MERLTERELYDGKVCFTKCSKTNCLDTCTNCDIPKEANVCLKEYEDLEEQGKLLKLPCAVGDTVYVVERSQTGSTMIAETTVDSFYCALWMLDGKFGRSIFTTLEEAEAALEELKRK